MRSNAKRLALLSSLVAALCALVTIPSHAVEPDEILPDAKLESRARNLSSELRCLVCQNQSIDDSNAPLARDLRLLVRERLKQGDNDEAVLKFVVERYGDFVLLRPPFNLGTLLLWLGPAALLLLTLTFLVLKMRNGSPGNVRQAPLSTEEKARLADLLKTDKQA